MDVDVGVVFAGGRPGRAAERDVQTGGRRHGQVQRRRALWRRLDARRPGLRAAAVVHPRRVDARGQRQQRSVLSNRSDHSAGRVSSAPRLCPVLSRVMHRDRSVTSLAL